MALRFSKGFRNFLNEGGSMKQALANGELRLYSGSQPASADDAVAGTLRAIITVGGAARTAEVKSVGSVELTGGASGSVDTLTVNSIEIMGSATPFNGTLAQTAQDVVDKINDNPMNLLFLASRTSDTIVITAKPGLGALANGWVVASTVTTITKTDNNMAGGVTALNGLLFNDSIAGIMTKLASQVWSGLGLSDGTVGWFRYVGSVADAGNADAAEVFIRVDGSVATSGANLNSTNTNVVTGATQTVGSFSITVPAQ
jgi:hypothetical protein